MLKSFLYLIFKTVGSDDIDDKIKSKPDPAAKEFLLQDDVFTDLVTEYCFGGRTDLSIDPLIDKDTQTRVVAVGKNGQLQMSEMSRDLYKMAAVRSFSGTSYILVGLEPQTYLSRELVVKILNLDASSYRSQVKKHQERHESLNDRKNDEFLSGLQENDKLMLSATIVIWLSPEPWTGPRNLNELIEVPEGYNLKIPDYPLNIIEPAALSDEQLLKYGSQLGPVLIFIKYSRDFDQLKAAMDKFKKYFTDWSRSAADVIESVTKTDLNLEAKGGKVNMCEAIEQLKSRSTENGFRIGTENGIRIGTENGIRIGKKEQKRNSAKKMRSMQISYSDMIEILDCDVISGAQATVVRVIGNTLPVFEATLFRPLGNTLPVSPATLVRSISNTCSLNRQHLHLKNV